MLRPICNKTKLRDPITDEEMEPDEQLMRSIEEQIGITENAKKIFPRGDSHSHLIAGAQRSIL